jgi:hypothetical protein
VVSLDAFSGLMRFSLFVTYSRRELLFCFVTLHGRRRSLSRCVEFFCCRW